MKVIRRIKWYFISLRYRSRFITYMGKREAVLYGSQWDNDWECLCFRSNSVKNVVICPFITKRFEPTKSTLYSNFIIDKNMDDIR